MNESANATEKFRDKIYDALIIKREVAAEQILKDEGRVRLIAEMVG